MGARAWIELLLVAPAGHSYEMKAAPLLRAWVHRLRAAGVQFHLNHRWLGFDSEGMLRLANQAEEFSLRPNCTILALGGASWP